MSQRGTLRKLKVAPSVSAILCTRDGTASYPVRTVKTRGIQNITSIMNYPSRLLFLITAFLCSMAGATPLTLGEKFNVVASSELKSANAMYSAKNLVSPSLETAWCEGVEGDETGEWIDISLVEPIVGNDGLTIEILPGYVKSHETYLENGRPKKLAVMINDAIQGSPIVLGDDGKVQSFPINSIGKPIKKIRLTLLDVFPGAKFHDTCITDIVVRKRFSKEHSSDSRLFSEEYDTEMGMLREAGLLAVFSDDYRWAESSVSVDSLDMAMWLSSGRLSKGAEGSETLGELYMEVAVHKPKLFLRTLDCQSDEVFEAVTKKIISPVNDKYSNAQVRNALKRGFATQKLRSIQRFGPLLNTYSITGMQGD